MEVISSVMAARAAGVRAVTEPSGRSADVQRSRMFSGAPLTKRTAPPPPPAAAAAALVEPRVVRPPPSAAAALPLPPTQMTLIDLRSRSNSSTPTFCSCAPYASHAPCAMAFFSASFPERPVLMLLFLVASGVPIFSASTLSAPSVGSPTQRNCSFSSPNSMRASLQSAHTSATMTSPLSSAAGQPSMPPSSGLYVLPSTSKLRTTSTRAPGVTRRMALIWFVVSVPVLSLQMTVVQPSVSTLGSLRTMAFFLAILRVPSARQVVITAGSPSGMAATASATAILK
mmetsp:Transcript_13157/g.43355  ORF Transcript_13157/g.43355 Transcript_13157/m.43355 type:complete len:285 (+) Transcript_13157:1632-2486(+)